MRMYTPEGVEVFANADQVPTLLKEGWTKDKIEVKVEKEPEVEKEPTAVRRRVNKKG